MGSTRKVLRGLVVAGVALAAGAGATQSRDSAPSTTVDEQAIYESVLSTWLDGSHGRQMVDRRLGPPPSLSDNAECIKGLRFSESSSEASKTLDASFFHLPNVELVDGAAWRADDPERSVAQGKSVDAAVKQAFAHSLFSFSQIAFSADGKDALVSFGMTCGMLCGHGSTLRMHKSNGRWKQAGDCGAWISLERVAQKWKPVLRSQRAQTLDSEHDSTIR